MYGFLPLAADVTLTTGTVVGATPTGALLGQFNFLVEEDGMLTELAVCGTVLGGAAAQILTFGFYIDGTAAANAQLTLPIGAEVGATPQVSLIRAKVPVQNLSKGHHVVKAYGSSAAGDAVLKATVYDCRIEANRFSADALLGQGVNSKVQLAI
jgi:hypothetical protein